MNCKEVIEILPGFLANEVTPSERKLVQNHLATCAQCQEELKILAALQSRISEDLHAQASSAAPSAQAWSRLQAELDNRMRTGHPIFHEQRLSNLMKKIPRGAFPMKQIVYAVLAILILFAGLFAAVPGVRAAVVENVLGWLGYDFPSPNNKDIISWGTDWGFTPYNPDYMTGNLQLKGTMVGGETTTDELGLCYQPENPNPSSPFIVIKENHLDTPAELPVGQAVNLRGGDGVIDELPSGEVEWCLGSVSFDTATRLTFNLGNINIQIFGPFPKEQLIRIANSLQQAMPSAIQPENPNQP